MLSDNLHEYYEMVSAFCTWVEKLERITADAAERTIFLIMGAYKKTLYLHSCEEETEMAFDYNPTTLSFDVLQCDAYWAVHNPFVQEEPVCGSLTDDINDIYNDIRKGKLIFEAGYVDEAAWWWRWSFDNHWKYHAVDAIRALNWIEKG